VTQQYLAGELSLRLAELEAAVASQAGVNEAARLRREAEAGPLTALSCTLVRALELTDRLCWDSLAHGDTATFACEAAIGADLREFGLCARLLAEDHPVPLRSGGVPPD
jgi:hypothetical protein